MNIRVFLSSDNTFIITTHMYREVEDSRSGEVCHLGRPKLRGDHSHISIPHTADI